jgi:hypothetical protein
MANKKKQVSEQRLPEKLVIYKPDQLNYQKLHLCKYLSELPEIMPEEDENPGSEGKSSEGNEQRSLSG